MGHGAVPNVAITPEVDTSTFHCVKQPQDSVMLTAHGKARTGTSHLHPVTGHTRHKHSSWESTAPLTRMSHLGHAPAQGQPCSQVANADLCVQAMSLSNTYSPHVRPALPQGCTHTTCAKPASSPHCRHTPLCKASPVPELHTHTLCHANRIPKVHTHPCARPALSPSCTCTLL